jgi:hypothetical protein
MYLLKVFILNKPETMMIDLIAGMLLAAVSVLLIMLGKRQSLYEALRGSIISNILFFKFLGFPERKSAGGAGYNQRKVNIICFCAGMILGALTYFIESPAGSVAAVCAAMAGIAVLYAILCYPEAGFLMLLFAVPFLPPGNLIVTGALPCILVSGCYFLKLARGKRTFDFGIFDLYVLMFAVLILAGGLISVSQTGSIRPAMMYLCFTLMYFTSVNIIRSKEMIKRTVAAIMFSAFLVAVIGVYQNFSDIPLLDVWMDQDMFREISRRVVSTLENPNVLASYLILILPFIIVSVFIAKNTRARMPYIIYGALTLLCLVYTWSRGSWLGFIFLCLILFVIISRKVIAAYLGIALLVPFAPIVLSDSVINRFLSIGDITDSSTSYRVNIWQGTLRMLQDHFIGGIGIGREPFGMVYPAYALAGIESAPHSHSLYLQTFVESGLIGLVVLILVMFFFLQYCFTAMKKASEKYMKLYIAAGMCSAIGMMVNGFTDYIWYNYRVYLMFWLVISITAAICRFSLKNQAQE